MADIENPPFGLPEPVVLPRLLNTLLPIYADNEALAVGGQILCYAELGERVRDAAAAMVSLGIRPGDHIGILMGNSVEWAVLFYAAASIGAVTVPINTRFRLDELNYCLRQADISALFFAGSFLKINYLELLRAVEPAFDTRLPGPRLPKLKCAVMLGTGTCPAGARRMGALVPSAADYTAAECYGTQVQPDEILLIQYTSGTTSFAKGVMLSHRNMLQNAAAVARRMGMTREDRYFSPRPFHHVAGTTLSLLASLVTGACLITAPSFEVTEALRLLDEERCTLASGNDTIFLMLMGHPDFNPKRIHLRGGWAAAGPEIMQKIHDVMGVPHMVGAYGLSEASPNVVMHHWQDPLELRVHGWAKPHRGLDLRIIDPQTGAVLSAEQPGEIQVRGWSVMKGYYNKPEETARAIDAGGWLHTGDLGVLNAEGRLRMIGRLKDMFRVGGENVAPPEVEETLLAHPKVQLVQVIGVPDARLGEVPAAYVVLKPGTEAEPDELIAWCETRCANYKVPRYLRIVESFDDIGMTGSLKIQKNRLREHAIKEFNLR
jgi:fatty-acyl-CoA synthase